MENQEWISEGPQIIHWQFRQTTEALRQKCAYSEFFWSKCGKIRTRKTTNTDTFEICSQKIHIITDMSHRLTSPHFNPLTKYTFGITYYQNV